MEGKGAGSVGSKDVSFPFLNLTSALRLSPSGGRSQNQLV